MLDKLQYNSTVDFFNLKEKDKTPTNYTSKKGTLE